MMVLDKGLDTVMALQHVGYGNTAQVVARTTVDCTDTFGFCETVENCTAPY